MSVEAIDEIKEWNHLPCWALASYTTRGWTASSIPHWTFLSAIVGAGQIKLLAKLACQTLTNIFQIVVQGDAVPG